MEKKICTNCKIEKNLNEYSMDGKRRRSHCKECRAKSRREYYIENRENELIQKKVYTSRTRNSLEHIKMRLIAHSKKRAKKNGIIHSISMNDIQIPSVCPIFGIKMSSNSGGIPLANSYSLDKINPQLGYVAGNVKVISYRANTIKGDGTLEEHLQIAKYINTNNSWLKKITTAIKAFYMLAFG